MTEPPLSEMNMRDWFAGQALVGLVTNNANAILSIEELAQSAYVHADAMMVERNVDPRR